MQARAKGLRLRGGAMKTPGVPGFEAARLAVLEELELLVERGELGVRAEVVQGEEVEEERARDVGR